MPDPSADAADRADSGPVTRHPFLAGRTPRAFAHRGWHIGDLDGLENSLAAFRRAVEEGYTHLETDVHATADGQLVAFHDDVLDRVTNARGAIAVAERASYIGRIRDLCKACAEAYVAQERAAA